MAGIESSLLREDTADRLAVYSFIDHIQSVSSAMGTSRHLHSVVRVA